LGAGPTGAGDIEMRRPADPAKHRADAEAWARRVGWRK